jgi:hypothetical protein
MNHSTFRVGRTRYVSAAAILGLIVFGAATACGGQPAAPDASPSPAHAATSAPVPDSSSGGSQKSMGAVSPGAYVAGAWLSAAQMPFARAGVITWDAQAGVGTRRTNGV